MHGAFNYSAIVSWQFSLTQAFESRATHLDIKSNQ